MLDAEPGNPSRLKDASEVFRAWLEGRQAAAAVTVEQLCVAHPGLVDELRQRHAVFQWGQAAAVSRSFQESLREQFGDAEQVTVKLEEPFAPEAASFGAPPSCGPEAQPAKAGTPSQAGRYAVDDEV